MIEPQTIFQTNYGYSIPLTFVDGNGNPVNITGATLTFQVQSAQDPSGVLVPTSGSMVIDNAAEGLCHYVVASGDFLSAGEFITTITATWSTTEVLSSLGPLLLVQPSMPREIN